MKTKTETFEHNSSLPPGKLESSVIVVTETAPHSVDLSCNAKGQYSWTIKLYFKEENKEGIVDEVEKINQKMLKKFPNIDDTAKIAALDTKAQAKK